MKSEKTESIIIRVWEQYEFKLFPGSKTTKPYVYFQFLNPVTNKEERIRKLTGLKKGTSVANLKKIAKGIVDELIELLLKGWNPINNNFNGLTITPLSPIIHCTGHWLKERSNKLKIKAIKPKTLANNIFLMDYFTKWLEANSFQFRKPSSFTRIDVDNFLQTTAFDRKWGKVSYNCYRTDLGTFFNYLKITKVITENPVPFSEKKNLKRDSTRFVIYEESELADVVKKLANDTSFFELYVASKLVYYFNIRPVEITRIQVKNIDFDKRILTLPAEKTKNENEGKWLLNDELYFLLEDLVANAPADYFAFGGWNRPKPIQLSKDFFGARWRIFREKYNIPPRLKFYALKHTSNYYDLQDGASFEEIRQRNRHANLQVTTLYIRERLFKNIIKPSGSNRF